MNDKNGIELRTGQIVEITGGFFKADNGRFVIVHSPGDEGWIGKEYSLRKVSKKNEFSLAKYAVAFWPLSACTSDHFKNIEADAHNAKNAKNNGSGVFCSICGKKLTFDNFEVDHIYPWAKGGKTEPSNLQPLCKDCNRKKGASNHDKI